MKVPTDEILPGDTVKAGTWLEMEFTGLKEGDNLLMIQNGSTEKIVCEGQTQTIKRKMEKKGYFRVEIRRRMFGGMEESLVFVSNPWYIE